MEYNKTLLGNKNLMPIGVLPVVFFDGDQKGGKADGNKAKKEKNYRQNQPPEEERHTHKRQ